MKKLVSIAVLLSAAFLLSGCVVAEVGGAVVGAGVTVVSTAVDVTADGVKAVAHTVGGSDEKKADDKSDNPDKKEEIKSSSN